MPPTRHADVIVLGLGAMGSAVALRLAERGARVIGLDRFVPPHTRGSSHGETRITRLAIGEGAEYVPLARRAHELWPEIERAAGVRILHPTGGLVLGQPAGAFLAGTRAAAEAYGIAHENLGTAALRRRFPMFNVEAGTEGYLEPTAGYLRPEVAVAAQLALAARHGADIRTGERVRDWHADATGVSVRTAAAALRAERLVICAGAWITGLVPELAGRFAVQRQLLFWFEVAPQAYATLGEMPIFIWDFGGERHEFAHGVGFYGFPAIDGPAGGLKVGTETERAIPDPDGRAPASPAEAAEMYAAYVAPRLRGLTPATLRSAACLYTSTRGSRFIIDEHPAHANVLLVSPCSGHGFKHSPAIGEAVAERLTDGASTIDLTPFALGPPVP